MSRRNLVLLTLLGLGLRILFLLAEPKVKPSGDEPVWIILGVKGVYKTAHPFSPFDAQLIFYPPAYPYLIAAARALVGSPRAVLWFQAFLGVLLVPVLGWLGERLSPRAGLWGALLGAVYPELIWYAAHFWSETFFLLFVWWSFERVIAARARSNIGAALVAGGLIGLATLTRETVLWFIPVVTVWLLWGRVRNGAKVAAAFALGAILTVAPWTARNFMLYHSLVPVATGGALNLWEGNARLARNEVYALASTVEDPIAQYHQSWSMAIAAIRERQPLWFGEKLVSEMPAFWGAESEAAMHIERGAYRSGGSPAAARLARRLLALPYLAVLALGFLGLALLEPDSGWWLLLTFAVYYNLLHVVSHAMDRYRLPVMPVLFLLCGVGWGALRSGEIREKWRTHALRLGLMSAAFLTIAYWSLR
jgi:hypothetical protein